MKYLIFLLSILTFSASAQFGNVTLPDVSQEARVTQKVGLTELTIHYNRPGVKGRKLWGTNLVPYNNKPRPWRAGADENTIFTFSHSVNIQGNEIPAGTYGFHIIPGEEEWILIFSSNSSSWGSFSYNEEEDVARANVTPRDSEHTEWLTYNFSDVGADYAVVTLEWEKKAVDLKIEVDVHQIVLNSIRDELRGVKGYGWEGWSSAAGYCLNNDINYEEALGWIDQSIEMKEQAVNLFTKAQILRTMGKDHESESYLNQALSAADEGEINFFGWQYWKDFNQPEKALEIFKVNIDKSDNWISHYLSAQVYQDMGELEKAKAKAIYCEQNTDDESRKATARNLIAAMDE